MTDKEIAINMVSKVTGVAKSKILSSTRVWPAVEARQMIVLILAKDGYTDESIGLALNRKRCVILKSRTNALHSTLLSVVFREKFNKAREMYEHEKSLRTS